MSDWLYLGLNADDFAKRTSESGVTVSSTPSPYDVPEAARTNFDESHGRFSIEFEYIGTEPLKSVAEEPGISFRLGRNSGRIYGIDVEVGKVSGLATNTVDSLTGLITQTISGLSASPDLSVRSNNYEMVCQVVTSEKNALFEEAKSLLLV